MPTVGTRGVNTLPVTHPPLFSVPSVEVTLTWNAASTAHADSGYHWQVATVPGTVVVDDGRTGSLSAVIDGLSPGTAYQWRIATGMDSENYNSPWSAWIPFTTPGTPPVVPPPAVMPLGVPAAQVGALLLNATGADMLAWQHTAQGNQGQPNPGTYALDAAGNLSLSISGAAGSFCQVWGPAFGPNAIYEARVFLPDNGSGAIADWPAWWLYGGNNADELDIIEGLGGRSAAHLWWAGGNAGIAWSTIGPGWHTGTAVITGSSVTVYIDGKVLGSRAGNPLVTQLNVIHDIMAGSPPGTTQSGPPATYLAQYTRVWALA